MARFYAILRRGVRGAVRVACGVRGACGACGVCAACAVRAVCAARGLMRAEGPVLGLSAERRRGSGAISASPYHPGAQVRLPKSLGRAGVPRVRRGGGDLLHRPLRQSGWVRGVRQPGRCMGLFTMGRVRTWRENSLPFTAPTTRRWRSCPGTRWGRYCWRWRPTLWTG